jgi:TRAP-type C4-dicarboxylate transport system permease small subunit
MHELAILAIVVVAIMAATTTVADEAGRWLCRIEIALMAAAAAIAVFVMLFVTAEVVMRYGFSAPIPGHLEGSELLMPIIVFLGISSTCCRRGPDDTRRWARCC